MQTTTAERSDTEADSIFFLHTRTAILDILVKFLISIIRTAKASNKQCDLFNKESQEFIFNHNIRML